MMQTVCENCFQDKELKAIVRLDGTVGTCDLCRSKDVHVCRISGETGQTLKEAIGGLLDVYVRCFPGDKSIPCLCHARALESLLVEETGVFNLTAAKVRRLLQAMFRDEKLFATKYVSRVEIARASHDSRIWILPDGEWERFENDIKFVSRFNFTSRFKRETFKNAAIRCVRRLERGTTYFRARKFLDGALYTRRGMFPPPKEKCISGRLNPSGIRLLYLADSIDTALSEMRPKVREKFCVAQFALKRNLSVLDLSQIALMSPFAEHMDPLFYVANRPTLLKIAQEFRRVVDGSNNDLDYLITQYVCDVSRQCGWAGILYDSTLHDGGRNLALFDVRDAKMIPGSVSLYDIEPSPCSYRKVEP